jgi:hypothetical protein
VAKLTAISEYLKAGDLSREEDTVLTIASIEDGEVKNRETGVTERIRLMRFEEVDQAMILKPTNIALINKALGDCDLEDMPGKKIALYVKDDITFGSKIVEGIRVRPKAVK